ncbi:hypothetical protein FOPE_06876 [Fonsecaea pedrosoi]|nr:hypothetical protein FOPE_06876 [Fonsecaea pedrosoi]
MHPSRRQVSRVRPHWWTTTGEDKGNTPHKTKTTRRAVAGSVAISSVVKNPVPIVDSRAFNAYLTGESDMICSPAGENLAYVGRPEYLPGEFATEGDSDGEAPKCSRGDAEMSYLQSLKAFDFPPRPVRDGLIDNFLKICSPWMPVVEIEDLKLQNTGSGPTSSTPGGSLLLTQAVLVAGSRVQPTGRSPNSDCASFYSKAKALFFADVETDPLNTISALCLMQWYNPSGPEHVSIHSSGFWLRTAVGLGYQIGLHREPDPKSVKCKLRRRLFWTLFLKAALEP